jgi:hypothetical protein
MLGAVRFVVGHTTIMTPATAARYAILPTLTCRAPGMTRRPITACEDPRESVEPDRRDG